MFKENESRILVFPIPISNGAIKFTLFAVPAHQRNAFGSEKTIPSLSGI
jgi:hypothetical protein